MIVIFSPTAAGIHHRLPSQVISPKLGGGTLLRFNQPTEAAQLKETFQSGLPSAFSLPLTGMSNSTETLSEAMLQNPGRMEEKLNQQEVEWQQVQENLNRHNIKRLSKENSRAPHQSIAERKATGAEMEETGNGQMEMQSAETATSIVPHSCLTSATIEKLINTVIPGKDPVHITSIQMDRDTLQDGISTRDGREQEGDLCHKSGPGLMSEWPRRKAREEVWSGDASLQQTSVLGPGDGCGTKPEGNANKIKGAMADCYKERPDSGGSSLSSMSHLQSSRGTRSTSVLPQNSTHPQLDIKPLCSQAARCPPEKTIFEGLFGCAEMDESGGLQGFTTEVETAAASIQHSGLGSLCSDVRCVLVHDEDERGAVSLDVTLANARGRGHPESVTKAASPSAHASNSSPQAEVWKLTFSCSSEAAFLIKHLSNV
ncbi:hypothetical protein JOQ06_021145 [Pogonophryne albipinna]|uniref:Uncharacterized protein n=1 Tax=Pogonophryne albipinna TaxID=1090488 RepID=A0AAD6BVB5_9TELE|nr:hypothetical protein JOQ06_021145 [Pogonophryne albipinna]